MFVKGFQGFGILVNLTLQPSAICYSGKSTFFGKLNVSSALTSHHILTTQLIHTPFRFEGARISISLTVENLSRISHTVFHYGNTHWNLSFIARKEESHNLYNCHCIKDFYIYIYIFTYYWHDWLFYTFLRGYFVFDIWNLYLKLVGEQWPWTISE